MKAGSVLSDQLVADFTPIGTIPTGTIAPFSVCSDGLNFWNTNGNNHNIVMF